MYYTQLCTIYVWSLICPINKILNVHCTRTNMCNNIYIYMYMYVIKLFVFVMLNNLYFDTKNIIIIISNFQYYFMHYGLKISH